jgi:hypothetical protein
MDIEMPDTMANGWKLWLDWHNAAFPDNEAEIKALEADRGNYLGYIRLVGRRREGVKLADHIVSLPTQYTKKPLLRTTANSQTTLDWPL